jgi:hypothetical protein
VVQSSTVPGARVLIVTDRAEAGAALLDAVRERAAAGPAEFHVLVPNPAAAEWHPLHSEPRAAVAKAERDLLRMLPVIQDVADGAVRGHLSARHEAMAAIEELLHDEPFDEIVLALAAGHPDRLARRVVRIGLPVTTVR